MVPLVVVVYGDGGADDDDDGDGEVEEAEMKHENSGRYWEVRACLFIKWLTAPVI